MIKFFEHEINSYKIYHQNESKLFYSIVFIRKIILSFNWNEYHSLLHIYFYSLISSFQ
jgi:uncharacterized membrane protein YGL010W